MKIKFLKGYAPVEADAYGEFVPHDTSTTYVYPIWADIDVKKTWESLTAFTIVEDINGVRGTYSEFKRQVADPANSFMAIICPPNFKNCHLRELPKVSVSGAIRSVSRDGLQPRSGGLTYHVGPSRHYMFATTQYLHIPLDFSKPPRRLPLAVIKDNEVARPEKQWAAMLNFPGLRDYDIKPKPYDLIRNTIRRELGAGASKVYKWVNLCEELSAATPLAEIRQWAKTFGVPPQFWNDPKKVCALITPRVSDFNERVVCDNDDEPTLDGEPVGSIPEYLKYTYFNRDNGKVYCSNVVDLHRWMEMGETRDPLRRFTFDQEMKDDIAARMAFIKMAIEPHGYGAGLIDKIRYTPLVTTPLEQLRAQLVKIWSKMEYPAYTIEGMLQASQETLNSIMASIVGHQGIQVSRAEKEMYRSANGRLERLAALSRIMARIVNQPDGGVALQDAIHESTQRSNEPSIGVVRRERDGVEDQRGFLRLADIRHVEDGASIERDLRTMLDAEHAFDIPEAFRLRSFLFGPGRLYREDGVWLEDVMQDLIDDQELPETNGVRSLLGLLDQLPPVPRPRRRRS